MKKKIHRWEELSV